MNLCPESRQCGEGKYCRCNRFTVYNNKCAEHLTAQDVAEVWARWLKTGRARDLEAAEAVTNALTK